MKCNLFTGCKNDAVWSDDKHNYCEYHFLHEYDLFNSNRCKTCGKEIPCITTGDIEYYEQQDIYCSIECAAKAYGCKRIGDDNV